MKIVIPGGTGHLGQLLTAHFRRNGHEVVVLTRRTKGEGVHWDGRTLGPWAVHLDGADVLINLAGRSVNCRYDAKHKAEIMSSRVDSTRILGQAIAAAAKPPRVWLQSSTATIYPHRFDAANDESSPTNVPTEWQFSIDVAHAWERALDEAPTPHTRKVAMRSAVVMEPSGGGPFDLLLTLVRLGLGGRAADGRQFVSWIHHVDFARALDWLIDRNDISGIVNIAAPNPLPNAEFMRDLRRAWGIGFGLPAARWMLELAAPVIGTETELILKSRRVVPARLLRERFAFAFPTWDAAARDLCDEWRRLHRRQWRGTTDNGVVRGADNPVCAAHGSPVCAANDSSGDAQTGSSVPHAQTRLSVPQRETRAMHGRTVW